MTVDRLIELLRAVPREYRGLTVYVPDLGEYSPVLVVDVFPEGTIPGGPAGVSLLPRLPVDIRGEVDPCIPADGCITIAAPAGKGGAM